MSVFAEERKREREEEIRLKIAKLKREGRLGEKGAMSEAAAFFKRGENRADAANKYARRVISSEPEDVSQAKQRGSVADKYAEEVKSVKEATKKNSQFPDVESLDDVDVFGGAAEKSLSAGSVADKYADKVKAIKEAAKKRREEDALDRASLQEEDADLVEEVAERLSSKRTSGVGGTWAPPPATDTYKPSRGSWGAFERPSDISAAYGGGRKVGADAPPPTPEELEMRRRKEEETMEKLRAYREKVGGETATEKKNKVAIDRALDLARRGMSKGLYMQAVDALEQVTEFCSPASERGGRLFLELGMAYEAIGRKSEAVTVYTNLSTSARGKIKTDAKRLLFGAEAMEFMKYEDTTNKEAISSQFIDTSILSRLSEYDDKAYNVNWINTEKGSTYYKKMQERLVESPSEAKRILIQSQRDGGSDRAKVVQALARLGREFNNMCSGSNKPKVTSPRKVPMINGVIIRQEDRDAMSSTEDAADTRENFVYMDGPKVLDFLDGDWSLKMSAGGTGDNVKFYFSSQGSQSIDAANMKWEYSIPGWGGNQSNELDFEFIKGVRRRMYLRGADRGIFGIGAPLLDAVDVLCADADFCVLRAAGDDAQRRKKSDSPSYYYVFVRS